MTSFRALFLRNAAAAVVLPLAALTLYLWRDQEGVGREALDRELRLGITAAQQLRTDASPAGLQQALIRLDRALGLRMTVIDGEGHVLADGEGDPGRMTNHLDRPEVRAALRDGSGTAERFSTTLGRDMRYLAVVDRTGVGIRIYRAAVPLAQVQAQVRRTQITLLFAMAAAMLLALFVAHRLSRQLILPIQALIDASSKLSAGQAQVHVTPEGPLALRRLAETFNTMSNRLCSQVRSLDESQAYLEAILRQMPEGLLVVDHRGVVTRVNPAAETLLAIPAERMLGKPLLAGVLHYALEAEVRRVLKSAETGADSEVTLVDMQSPEKRSLRVAVGAFFITSVEPRPAGAVLIVQDLTELRRTDDMRRDFVANVSHELRTPVAAIRALAETLMLRGERRPELMQEYGPPRRQ